jgi:hypothetical protein
MKPITWLRKFAARGFQGYPMATLAFYGPDDRKASKVVLGIIEFEGGEPVLHKWVRDPADKDLRYDVSLQNAWIEIIRREGAQTLSTIKEINGCPHEEGVDYPVGKPCPDCPFWAGRLRPLDLPENAASAIATYDPAQWDALLAAAADRDDLEDSWEEWNAGLQKVITEFGTRGHPFILVSLDVDEINQFCQGKAIPNDSKARAQLAAHKARSGSRQ